MEKASRQAGYVPDVSLPLNRIWKKQSNWPELWGGRYTVTDCDAAERGDAGSYSLIQGFVTAEQIEEAIRKAEEKNDEQE